MRYRNFFIMFLFAAKLSVASAAGQLIPYVISNAPSGLNSMGNAADGNPATYWNSEAFPTQWVDIDLGSDRLVSMVRMLTAQSPSGDTIHHVYGRTSSGTWIEISLGRPSFTTDAQWITRTNLKLTPVRYLIIQTTKSPSWVAWRDFQVYDGGDLVRNCTSMSPGLGWVNVQVTKGGCPGYTSDSTFVHRNVNNQPSGALITVCSPVGLPVNSTTTGWTNLGEFPAACFGYNNPGKGTLYRKN